MKKVFIITVLLGLMGGIFFMARNKPVHAQIAPTYERAITNFFTKMKQNHLESAVKGLWENNEWTGAEKDDMEAKTGEMKTLQGRYGKLLTHVRLGQKIIGERYVYIYFLAVYENEPIGFAFELYKPERKWLFLSFDFDDEIRDHTIGGTLTEIFGE